MKRFFILLNTPELSRLEVALDINYKLSCFKTYNIVTISKWMYLRLDFEKLLLTRIVDIWFWGSKQLKNNAYLGYKFQLFILLPGVYMKMLAGLGQAVMYVTILLPFAVESNVNQFFEIRKGGSFLSSTEVQWTFFKFHLEWHTPPSDFRFVGHVIETSTSDEFECGMRCSRNVKCRSYNLPSDGHLGNKTCEMNDQIRRMKPKDLKPIKGFIYYEKGK